MSPLTRLNNWYQSHCDGEWEHAFGIAIGTLDNPGWTLKINLQDTELQYKPFAVLSIDNDDDKDDWVYCEVEEGIFHGACGPKRLDEMLETFLDWAEP